MITIIDVARTIGVETDKSVMWSVGDIMQARYAKRYGQQPPKDNRPKTNGGGSHCFAIYPQSWFALIAYELKKQGGNPSPQVDMFQ